MGVCTPICVILKQGKLECEIEIAEYLIIYTLPSCARGLYALRWDFKKINLKHCCSAEVLELTYI